MEIVKKPISYCKSLSIKKILYLPRLFSETEKRLVLLALAIGLIAVGILAGRVYFRVTVAAPAVGGIYTEGMLREPRAINPVLASNDADRDIARLVFSRLITYQKNGIIEYDLAEKVKISEDGKTYTVTLKPGVRWHDGEELTADDVIFTVKMVQNPQFKSALRANWQGVTAEKIDDRTLQFILRSPYAPFIENLTLGILPRHLWETIGPKQVQLHELNLKPVGSGPYEFSQSEKAKDGSLISYTLRRNPDYYRDGPFLEKIVFRFFKKEEEALIALRRGDIEGLGTAAQSIYPNLDKERFSLRTLSIPRIFGIFLNEKQASILADRKVRQAIAYGLDKTALAGNVTGGAIASDAPIPISEKSEEAYPYDPEKAGALLEEAGWKVGGNTSEHTKDSEVSAPNRIREKTTKEKGKSTTTPLRLTLSTSDWPDLVRTADSVASMLREIGIGITLDIRPFIDLETSVIRQRNFQMLLFGHVYGYEVDPFSFWHSSQAKDPGLNVSLYANKKADQLLEEARRISDPVERTGKYKELSNLLLQDLPAIFLYSQLYLYLVPAEIKGMGMTKISLPADRFNDVNKWYKHTKRVLK